MMIALEGFVWGIARVQVLEQARQVTRSKVRELITTPSKGTIRSKRTGNTPIRSETIVIAPRMIVSVFNIAKPGLVAVT